MYNKKINDLEAAEYNPRFLSEKQANDLDESLRKFGFVDPVIVNVNPKRHNIIVGGHKRTERWKLLGNDDVPCIEVNLDVADEKELNIRLNKNTGEWDWKTLEKEFEQFQLVLWGFELEEFDRHEEHAEVSFKASTADALTIKVTVPNKKELKVWVEELKKAGLEPKIVRK